MPARDGTGPRGEGPMTGRGQGNCNPDNKTTSFGRGCGCGRGRGCGQERGLGYRNQQVNKE